MPNIRKTLSIEDENFWYLVGLITSDGCLRSDGRHIDITSKDYKFLLAIKNRFGFINKIGTKYNSNGKQAFHIQIANKNFYDHLLSIGLTPQKSLTLDALRVPNQFFNDFLRGIIDGDGCIRAWMHPSNRRTQWSLRIYSGSRVFIRWLKETVETLFKIKGKIYQEKNNVWILKHGKLAAQILLKKCYYKGCFGLDRKILLANICVKSQRGWSKSKTVYCSS